MDKKTILWIVLGILVLLVAVQTIYLSSLGKLVAGKAVAAAASNPAPAPAMVGGC